MDYEMAFRDLLPYAEHLGGCKIQIWESATAELFNGNPNCMWVKDEPRPACTCGLNKILDSVISEMRDDGAP